MKTLMLLLGNGVTIDFINQLGKSELIDTQNLFCKGDLVPWPDGQGEKGFLSYKYCRNLWNIGARPYMSTKDANSLIEDILSCANMVLGATSFTTSDNIYINAYYELAAYLKQLFVYYNKMISEEDLQSQQIRDWGWYRLIKAAYSNPNFENIIIITYNYDVFLERVLRANNIPFDISLISDNDNKIKILKPHGSINFAYKIKSSRELYSIRKSAEMNEATISDFSIDYTCMDNNYLVSALIPPSGDSSRLTYRWAREIREKVKEYAQQLDSTDKLIISGLSYWHVDRKEIDDVLTTVDHEVHTYLVNPNPPRALNAVLSCIFENYIVYMNSNALGGLI